MITKAVKKENNVIGRLGENEARVMQFYVGDVQRDFPGCSFAVLNRRPNDPDAYPVNSSYYTVEGENLLWTVMSGDLTQEGIGECEIIASVNEQIVKSEIYATRILRALDGAGDPPEPWQSWVQDVEEAAERAEAAAELLEHPGAEATTLNPGESATASYSDGTFTFGIPRGADGAAGRDGQDGFSPIATVSKSGKIATISITDKNGTTTANVSDGENGQDGHDGQDGQDGITPNVTAGTTTTGAAGTNANVERRTGSPDSAPVFDFTIPKGDKGDPGEVTEAELTAGLNGKADIVTDTVTDQSIATIPDGADGLPVKELEVAVTPVQDLHGYDNPWPAGGGKNILPTSGLTFGYPSSTAYGNATQRTFTVGTYITGLTHNNYYQDRVTNVEVADNSIKFTTGASAYGVSIPLVGLEVGSKYTISATTTSGIVGLSFYQQDGTFISGSNAGATTKSPCTSTVPENTYYTLAVFQATTDNTEATFTNIQLEKSNSATSFAPYSNICPITGWTGANISRTGVNVWDEQWEVGSYNASGQKTTASDRIRCKNPIPVVPNTTYYFNHPMLSNNVPYIFYIELDANGTSLDSSIKSLYNTKILTTSSKARYLLWTGIASYGTTYNHDISINYPSSDTQYHPGKVDTYSITFPNEAGTVYGATLTVNEDGTGELVVDRASVTFNGTQAIALTNWRILTNSVGWLYSPDVTPGIDNTTITNVGNTKFISDTLKTVVYSGNSGIYGLDEACVSIVGSANYAVAIRICDTTLTTENAINTYLSQHPIQVVYELATPVTYTMSEVEVISLLKGVNNVWADTGDILSMEYPCDTKLYVSKQIEASNRLMELIITANHEDSMKATKAYTSGNLMIVNGTLYRATTSIANGATLTVGTNVSKTTVGDEIAQM